MNLQELEEFQILLKNQKIIFCLNKLKTLKKLIDSKKIFLIGEISGNHLNNFEIVKKIVRRAKKAGFNAIKIQSFSADAMTLKSRNQRFLIKEGIWKKNYLWDLYSKSSMSYDLQMKIFKFCKKQKILCFASPFDTFSVDFLEKIRCPIYKLASPEINHFQLIKKISKTKKPLIISTGMASIKEIEETFNYAKSCGIFDLSIMYCVSNYPADISDFNMNNIRILKEKFQCPIGFSDHSTDNDVAKTAIMQGATIVEKHISLDSKKGVDSKFSLVSNKFSGFRKDLDKIKILSGKQNFFRNKSELKNKRYRRSIFAIKDILKGEKFTLQNIKVIRPSFGLKPKYYDYIIGKKAKKAIKFANPLHFKNVKK